MAKFDILSIDPPYEFSDKLNMADTKRSANSQYSSVLKPQDIIKLPIKDIVSDNAFLVNWVPGAHLQCGLDCIKSWGFTQKQVYVWVKTKKIPLSILSKECLRELKKDLTSVDLKKSLKDIISNFNTHNVLSFYMGHWFRQTHEIALVCTRGKMMDKLADKSQRSVCFDTVAGKEHSEKPEYLQDSIDIMFPDSSLKRIEIFARRNRPGWICVGNEVAISFKEDILVSIDKLKKLNIDSNWDKIRTYSKIDKLRCISELEDI